MEGQASSTGTLRKRGRPAGKNRVPLSVEEKRARNTQYERERRREYADAIATLAVASGCSSDMTNTDIIASVVSLIQRAEHIDASEDINSLRRCNEKLLMQIQSLEQRLTADELAALNASLSEQESADEDANTVNTRAKAAKKGRKKIKQEIKKQKQEECTLECIPESSSSTQQLEQGSGERPQQENMQWPHNGNTKWPQNDNDQWPQSGNPQWQQHANTHWPESSHWPQESTRWMQQENAAWMQNETSFPVDSVPAQWPQQSTFSSEESSPDYYTATAAYLPGPSCLETPAVTTLLTWPEAEIQFEDTDSDGSSLQRCWSIEDFIATYL